MNENHLYIITQITTDLLTTKSYWVIILLGGPDVRTFSRKTKSLRKTHGSAYRLVNSFYRANHPKDVAHMKHPRITRMAPCHPNLPLTAHGLCQPCYRAWKAGAFALQWWPGQWAKEVRRSAASLVTIQRLAKDKRLEMLLANACRPLKTTVDGWQSLAAHLHLSLVEVTPNPVLDLWAAVAREDARRAALAMAEPAPDTYAFAKTRTLEERRARCVGSVASAERIKANAKRRVEAQDEHIEAVRARHARELRHAEEARQRFVDEVSAAEARRLKAESEVASVQAEIDQRLSAAELATAPALEAHAARVAAAQDAYEEALQALQDLCRPLDPSAASEAPGAPAGPSRAALAIARQRTQEPAPTSDHLSDEIDTGDLARPS